MQRMVTQLNRELSPFKDEGKQDSLFLRQMLDNYRKVEDFERSTTTKKIVMNDRKVH